jgi:nucleotide sugar dehydrogenase
MNGTNVVVIGLGKIGLPLALQFAVSGHRVVGVDREPLVVEALNAGQATFYEPGLEQHLTSALESHNFQATLELQFAVENAAYIVMVIPLIVDEEGVPDFNNFDTTLQEIGKHLRVGTTLIIETTVPIGTTRGRFQPIIEKSSGFTCGQEFFLAFSPERVSSGTVFRDFKRYPKLVGGVDSKSTELASNLYRSSFTFDNSVDLPMENGVWAMSSSEAAEFTKLAETTYRDVNIALANTFYDHATNIGVDFSEVKMAANSQPFSHLHQPGFSVGGHCIPVYPHFYMSTDPEAELVRSARHVNVKHTRKMVDRAYIEASTRKINPKVLVSGLCYRSGVKEHAFSGAKTALARLKELHVDAGLTDELFSDSEITKLGFSPANTTEYDLLIINSGSREFSLSILDRLSKDALVFDGRGELKDGDWPNILR